MIETRPKFTSVIEFIWEQLMYSAPNMAALETEQVFKLFSLKEDKKKSKASADPSKEKQINLYHLPE